MSNISTHLASFNGYPIEVIDHHQQAWLTGEQIGLAIGLKHARIGANKLYNRHADEFTEKMTTVVDMGTVDGKQRQVRIFSSRGAWMLAMWAQTERAKQFRQWVLDVLETHQQPQADKPASKSLPCMPRAKTTAKSADCWGATHHRWAGIFAKP